MSEPGCRRLGENEPGKPGWGDRRFGAGFRKLTAKTGRKAHGQTERPELSGAQRGPGCGQDAARAGNTVAHTQHDRGGRMARACIPAGMRCTCLKLRDLVSACESSSSGSPSGPPASSSPAPAPRTADHVHLAHCTGDRICQGLNAMSAAAAPAVGTEASFLQNGGAVTGAGDPRMWLNERAPSGRAQRFLPRPAAPLAPALRSRRATRSPACPLPLSLPPGAAWLWGRLPPRAAWATTEPRPWSRPLGPNYWCGARGRRLGRLWGALPPPRWSRPALLRQGLPDRPADRARSPSSPRGDPRLQLAAPRAADVRFRACARCCAFPLPLLSVLHAATT